MMSVARLVCVPVVVIVIVIVARPGLPSVIGRPMDAGRARVAAAHQIHPVRFIAAIVVRQDQINRF